MSFPHKKQVNYGGYLTIIDLFDGEILCTEGLYVLLVE